MPESWTFPGRRTPILTLLLAALTDQAIGSQLGMSLRTVQRRVSGLMDRPERRR